MSVELMLVVPSFDIDLLIVLLLILFFALNFF